jgi:hypothetical protein
MEGSTVVELAAPFLCRSLWSAGWNSFLTREMPSLGLSRNLHSQVVHQLHNSSLHCKLNI